MTTNQEILLKAVSENCKCTPGQTTTTCEVQFTYDTQIPNRIDPKILIELECQEQITTTVPPVIPIDNQPPIITLTGPENDYISTNSEVNFEYSVFDNVQVQSCSLYVNGELDQIDQEYSGTFTKSFEEAKSINWNIECIDTSENKTVTDTINLKIYPNYIALTECSTITSDNNYVLLNNISGISGNCFTQESSLKNVVFDCAENSIVGDETGNGIFFKRFSTAQSLSNIVIKNCFIDNFQHGINIQSSESNITIINSNFSNNSVGVNFGHTVANQENLNIINNYFNNNTHGISTQASAKINIENNTINNSLRIGIQISNPYIGNNPCSWCPATIWLNDNNIDGTKTSSGGYGGIRLANQAVELILNNNRLGCIEPNEISDFVCVQGSASGNSFRSDSSTCGSATLSSC